MIGIEGTDDKLGCCCLCSLFSTDAGSFAPSGAADSSSVGRPFLPVTIGTEGAGDNTGCCCCFSLFSKSSAHSINAWTRAAVSLISLLAQDLLSCHRLFMPLETLRRENALPDAAPHVGACELEVECMRSTSSDFSCSARVRKSCDICRTHATVFSRSSRSALSDSGVSMAMLLESLSLISLLPVVEHPLSIHLRRAPNVPNLPFEVQDLVARPVHEAA